MTATGPTPDDGTAPAAPAARLVIASRLFPPEPGAAAYRLGALARALVTRGARVHVLTTRPPEASGAVSDAPGVEVSRWPVLRDRGGNVRGYVQFASFDGPLLVRLLLARRPDAIVVEPPPTTGTVVRLVAGLRRIPYVYYAGDVSSTAAAGIGVAAPIVRVLRVVESWAMSGAAAILTVSPEVAADVQRLTRGRVPVTTVGTGVDTDVFHPVAPATMPAADDSPTLVYAGTMSEIQGAGVFVEAFAQVAAEFPTARLVMYGQGAEQATLQERARRLAPGQVEFPGMAPGSAVAAALSTARAGLASLHPGMGYDYAFPTKMFAATACGTPVLYAGPGPGRRMTEEHRLGWACDWDVPQTAALMREALSTEPSPVERERLREWTLTHASQSSVGAAAATVALQVSADAGARGAARRRGRRARG